MNPVHATKSFTIHLWANKIKVVAGRSVLFIWPCSLSEGSERLTLSLCKHTALSHTVGQAGDSFSPVSQLSTRHANTTHF